ncbi:MAG: EamA family transporter [Flavobacterium sp.]|nr:EamA family transporter [Flavobacterium sp.]
MQIGAALMYTGTVMLFVIANKMTTSANAILLQYTAPIYAAIFGWIFLREKVSLLDWGVIVFVIAGMGLFFMGDLTGGNMFGNILAIISGVTFAAQAIFLKLQKGVNAASSIVLGNFFTFILSIPFLFQKVPTATDVTALVLMGVFQLGLAYSLYSFAVTRLSALETILLPVIEPILNPVWVFMFIGEIPGKWSLIGGLIVITSVTLRCYLVSKKQIVARQQKAVPI